MNQQRSLWLVAGISCVLAALVFLWWTIETVWLGSFPDRDAEAYSQWAIPQFALSVAFLVVAVVAFVRVARRPR
jgi:hypothetical protein